MSIELRQLVAGLLALFLAFPPSTLAQTGEERLSRSAKRAVTSGDDAPKKVLVEVPEDEARRLFSDHVHGAILIGLMEDALREEAILESNGLYHGTALDIFDRIMVDRRIDPALKLQAVQVIGVTVYRLALPNYEKWTEHYLIQGAIQKGMPIDLGKLILEELRRDGEQFDPLYQRLFLTTEESARRTQRVEKLASTVPDHLRNFHPLGDCTTSVRICDQFAQTLLALAPVAPRAVKRAAYMAQLSVETYRNSLTRDLIATRLRVAELMAAFYRFTDITPNGKIPRWNQKELKSFSFRTPDCRNHPPSPDCLDGLPAPFRRPPPLRNEGQLLRIMDQQAEQMLRWVDQWSKNEPVTPAEKKPNPSTTKNPTEPTPSLQRSVEEWERLKGVQDANYHASILSLSLQLFMDVETKLAHRWDWVYAIRRLPNEPWQKKSVPADAPQPELEPSGIEQFVPTELQKYFPEENALFDEFTQSFTQAVGDQIKMQAMVLKALVLYGGRLRQRDPRRWINENIEKTKMAALGENPDSDEGTPEYLLNIERYANASASSVDRFLTPFKETYHLGEFVEFEQSIVQESPTTESAFFAFGQFLSRMSAAAEAGENFTNAQYTDHEEHAMHAVQDRMVDVDEVWFRLKCTGLSASGTSHGSRFRPVHDSDPSRPVSDLEEFQSPLVKLKLDPESCRESTIRQGDGEGAAQFIDRITGFTGYYFKQAFLLELGPEIGAFFTVIVASIAMPIGGGITAAMGVRATARTAARWATQHLMKRIVLHMISTLINATIFIIIHKSLSHVVGIAPFWDPEKGFWGNFGKPILQATAVFLILPASHWMGQRLGQFWSGPLMKTPAMARAMAEGSIRKIQGRLQVVAKGPAMAKALADGSIKMMNGTPMTLAAYRMAYLAEDVVETAFFTGLEYAHRVIEKEFENPEVRVIRGWGDFGMVVRGNAMMVVAGFRVLGDINYSIAAMRANNAQIRAIRHENVRPPKTTRPDSQPNRENRVIDLEFDPAREIWTPPPKVKPPEDSNK